MLGAIIVKLITALVLTNIIECSVAFICGMRKGKDYSSLVLINTITNLLINWIVMSSTYFFGNIITKIITIVLELLLIPIEGYLIKRYISFKKINSYVFAIILNASSYLIGLIIFNIL